MKKKLKIITIAGASFLLFFLCVIFYHSYYYDNYYKTFYSNLVKGDVSSNECLNAWNEYKQKFDEDHVGTKYLDQIDYLYSYSKKRCLGQERIDTILLDDSHYQSSERIFDIVTSKDLFLKVVENKNGVFTTYTKDYLANREWTGNTDAPSFIFFNLKDLSQ